MSIEHFEAALSKFTCGMSIKVFRVDEVRSILVFLHLKQK